MRILVAPDKFKGSLGAKAVAENIATGLREVLRGVQIEILPVADGGEGTADILCECLGGEWQTCSANDALDRPITARFVWVEKTKLAIMEAAEAVGLWRLRESERNPARTTTFGIGKMLLELAACEAHEILIGLGGSATNDGGFGVARALGFRFLDDAQNELNGDVTELARLARIQRPSALKLPLLTIATDVQNPLLGKDGATRTFARQKGATPEQIEVLEECLTNLATWIARDLECDFRDVAGSGAAGGLGFGLLSFCGGRIRPGFDIIAEKIGLDSAIRKADVVITGEGCLDRQTLAGKAPAGVSRLVRNHGKPVFAIVGRMENDPKITALFDKVFPLARNHESAPECMAETPELLRQRARELAEFLTRMPNE